MPDFKALARPGIKRLRAYDPGHDLVALRRREEASGRLLVELGSNENSLGPSPRAREAVLGCLHEIYRYPDPLGGDLKQALAVHHGLDPRQLLLGNGSHELLMMLAQVFSGPETDVIASQFGFAVYALAAQAAEANLRVIPALPPEHRMSRGHDLHAIRNEISYRSRLVYLANPNNPTGTWFSDAELRRFLADLPTGTLVVVDEAYQEYVTDPDLPSAISLLSQHPNLIVSRTFSKAYGLAGLRVGYVAAHPALVEVVDRVRESFNVNLPGLAAAQAALADAEHLEWVRAQNALFRGELAGELRQRGIQVGPSQTNFLLLDFGRDAGPIESRLINRGVATRPMKGYGLPTCLRVTVGHRGENRRFLQALDEATA